MAIKQLTQEQVHSMTLEEKDLWWLKNVYKGDMPQLTLRSALSGMIIGGVLSLTNLYIGIRTGWTLGVGITSVIVAFAFFKLLSNFKIGSEITLLENNAMQSIATSAGYMTAPLVSSISAYMMVTNQFIPMYQTIIWIILLSLLGVLFAFPLKKRIINDEQLPFPEGRAAGVVMDNLHSDTGKDGLFKAKILGWGAATSATIEFLRADVVLEALKLKFLSIPHYWDEFVYKLMTPHLLGTPLKDLTIRWDTSIVMLATGGLMGVKTGSSLLVGAFLNYWLLAPALIREGVIEGPGFKNITMWALWGGVAMMTTSSLYAFFSKPKMLFDSFTHVFKKKADKKADVLKDIELPMWVFVTCIPIASIAVIVAGHYFFDIQWWVGVIAIPLVFVFTLIAVYSTGLTAITPGGALGKLTQLTFSVIAPGNIPTNIMTAGINGEVALNASNLLMDIKPGYMLGGKPRHQAIGHVLGIFAGAVVAVPVFYAILNNDLTRISSEALPMPGATIWKAVAEILIKGLDFLHYSAQIAIGVGAVLGITIEVFNQRSKGKFPLSAMGIGLAFVLPFADAWAMGLGSLIFWFLGRRLKDKSSNIHKIFVANQETLCAGVIAGGSIIGIVLIMLETLVFG